MEIQHYVYEIINKTNKKFYIGVRSCKIEPIEDIGIVYFSSSRDVDFLTDQKKNPDNFWYIIKRVFKTRIAAVQYESFLQTKLEVVSNTQSYNRSIQKSTSFDVTGYKHTEETKRKIAMASTLSNEKINNNEQRRERKSKKIKQAWKRLQSDPIKLNEFNENKKKAWVILKADSKKFAERNAKISTKLKKKYTGKNNINAHPVIQFNLQGKILHKWDTVKQASVSNEIDYSCVGAAASGRQKTAGGFKWSYIKNIQGPQW